MGKPSVVSFQLRKRIPNLTVFLPRLKAEG